MKKNIFFIFLFITKISFGISLNLAYIHHIQKVNNNNYVVIGFDKKNYRKTMLNKYGDFEYKFIQLDSNLNIIRRDSFIYKGCRPFSLNDESNYMTNGASILIKNRKADGLGFLNEIADIDYKNAGSFEFLLFNCKTGKMVIKEFKEKDTTFVPVSLINSKEIEGYIFNTLDAKKNMLTYRFYNNNFEEKWIKEIPYNESLTDFKKVEYVTNTLIHNDTLFVHEICDDNDYGSYKSIINIKKGEVILRQKLKKKPDYGKFLVTDDGYISKFTLLKLSNHFSTDLNYRNLNIQMNVKHYIDNLTLDFIDSTNFLHHYKNIFKPKRDENDITSNNLIILGLRHPILHSCIDYYFTNSYFIYTEFRGELKDETLIVGVDIIYKDILNNSKMVTNQFTTNVFINNFIRKCAASNFFKYIDKSRHFITYSNDANTKWIVYSDAVDPNDIPIIKYFKINAQGSSKTNEFKYSKHYKDELDFLTDVNFFPANNDKILLSQSYRHGVSFIELVKLVNSD